ncbi:MAG: NADH-quinone oxidoreductase subunit J [Actinomycetota bacterium]
MTGQEYAFVVLAAVGSISAIATVTARNVVHAALYLVVTLLSVGSVYLLLGAEFVAWVQILIYVGAIVILFLFGLMLTKAPIGRDSLDNQHRWVGALVAFGVFAGLAYLIQDAYPLRDAATPAAFRGSTEAVGRAIFHSYVLPFEAVSFLLLAALIGAVVLARKDDEP